MYSLHAEECLDPASARVLAGRSVVAPENSPCTAGKKYLWTGSPDEKEEASAFSGRRGQPGSGEGSNSSSLPCFCDGARPLITPINLHTKWPCSCRKQPRCRRGEANWELATTNQEPYEATIKENICNSIPRQFGTHELQKNFVQAIQR